MRCPQVSLAGGFTGEFTDVYRCSQVSLHWKKCGYMCEQVFSGCWTSGVFLSCSVRDDSSSVSQVVKVESGVTGVSDVSPLTPSQIAELHFLRSRVRELEREKAELSAENQRLKNMLVHGESPGHR